MNLILNNTSMIPIYEQVVSQLRTQILEGSLEPDTVLPSVRNLSAELKISALTVKKAYDCLEEEGYVRTVHGKGTYVSAPDPQLTAEMRRRQVEEELAEVIRKAASYGMTAEEMRDLLEILLEESGN